MTETAPDNKKRTHGAMWYCGWALFLYVASYLPVGLALGWMIYWGMPIEAAQIATIPYRPLTWLINQSEVAQAALWEFNQWIRPILPPPARGGP